VTRIGGSNAAAEGLSGVDAGGGGNGGVCARAFTHKSDNITANDANKSDSIAAPEPDDGSPTDHPHHETVSMILSIKVHTAGDSKLASAARKRRVADTVRARRVAGAARCGTPS
jgi:hypothetical protein